MGSYCVSISKGGRKIGAFYKECELIETLSILDYVKDIVNNYNRNLSGLNLPDIILAHRMLELQDEGLSFKKTGADIDNESYTKLYDLYPKYSMLDRDKLTDEGKIALTCNEINFWLNYANVSVTIEMDRCMIILHDMYHRFSVKEYAKEFFGGDKAPIDDIYTINFNHNHFYMNSLEEVCETLKENINGFRHPAYKNLVVVPISKERPKYEGIIL